MSCASSGSAAVQLDQDPVHTALVLDVQVARRATDDSPPRILTTRPTEMFSLQRRAQVVDLRSRARGPRPRHSSATRPARSSASPTISGAFATKSVSHLISTIAPALSVRASESDGPFAGFAVDALRGPAETLLAEPLRSFVGVCRRLLRGRASRPSSRRPSTFAGPGHLSL